MIGLHLQTPKAQRKDIKFVPVTINYDRVSDGESFPLQLLGERVQRDSLYSIVQNFLAVRKPLGKVIIKYCQPVSLNEFIEQHAIKNS
jgi:glycerol-3-phosphate O-acyltransferase